MADTDIRKQIEDGERQGNAHQKLGEAHLAIAASFYKQTEALTERERGMDAISEAEATLGHLPEQTAGKRAKRRRPKVGGQKPHTALYEDVLREHGRPMHLTDILNEALARGLQQKGKKPPSDQLRSALESAVNIYRVGGNRWWIVGVSEPETPTPPEEPQHNGVPVWLLDEEDRRREPERR